MAWISADAVFNPDSLGLKVVGIAAELEQHDSGLHQHKMGQLLFTQRGCIRITLSDRLCILPPTRIAWIPPRTLHRAEMNEVVGYRSIYLDVAQIDNLPSGVELLESTPLLSAVLERIALSLFDTEWQQGSAVNLLAVALDEIQNAQREHTILLLPSDRRLARLFGDELPPTLNVLTTQIGASEKTITRIFQRETGMSYQQWRQQWRFLKSIELLAKPGSISFIASILGFASDSAFVAFFKKMSGVTPRAYMSQSHIDEQTYR